MQKRDAKIRDDLAVSDLIPPQLRLRTPLSPTQQRAAHLHIRILCSGFASGMSGGDGLRPSQTSETSYHEGPSHLHAPESHGLGEGVELRPALDTRAMTRDQVYALIAVCLMSIGSHL